MVTVTISGRTATTLLNQGETATVELTPMVHALISRGYVTVAAPDDTPPPRNASTARWSTFLDTHGINYPPGASRRELIDLWDTHHG